MREYILLYVNGKRNMIRGGDVFQTLANFLRQHLQLTGTKIVCEEGDCGSCTVLVARYPDSRSSGEKLHYQSINACISPLSLLDCCSVVTVEGLSPRGENLQGKLSPIQEALATYHASQCGFCTPGFVCSLTGLFEEDEKVGVQEIKNACTGNLCRCTGYEAIIDGALHVDRSKLIKIRDRYHDPAMLEDFAKHQVVPINIQDRDATFAKPTSLEQVFKILENEPKTKILAGATDIGVLVNKHKVEWGKTITLGGITGASDVIERDNVIEIGPLVSLHGFAKALKKAIPEFSRYIHIFASPQIKNVGTIVGNIANGSPIGDSMPPLMVLDAKLLIISRNQPEGREIPLHDFYKGYKSLDLKPSELIWKVIIPIPAPESVNFFRVYKASRRKDLDISTVSAAFGLKLNGKRITEARTAFGGIAPYPVRILAVEDRLQGLTLEEASHLWNSDFIKKHISPISDLRGTAGYRHDLISQLGKRYFTEMLQNCAN